MANRQSLRSEIFLILATLLLVITISGILIIRYVVQMEGVMSDIIQEDLVNYQLAETLETSLVNQKGFVSYYYLDRNPIWLKQLGEYRQIFQEQLQEIEERNIKSCPSKSCRRESVNKIKKEYEDYIGLKDQVISYYTNGELEKGVVLHKDLRDRFFQILKACELYKSLITDNIKIAWEEKHAKAIRLVIAVVVATIITFVLIVALIIILVYRILDPLRILAIKTHRAVTPGGPQDDMDLLSQNVRYLIEDADIAQAELRQNRDILIQSEKLALVGKLAAGMAHSIRNPLTSVKMRLFSLGRTLDLDKSQKEDFQVISDEIRHLDTIVQNFLEFSRPPKLLMQRISLSIVVDQALQLLKHRLKSYNVTATVIREDQLPEIQADPEQLKEVFVNLIVNACESMPAGGEVVIQEEFSLDELTAKEIVIRFTDNGPGIPETILDKVLQPFFTTKEEGTGLGLSIALRIVEEHQGRITVSSIQGNGTTITLTFPIISDGV